MYTNIIVIGLLMISGKQEYIYAQSMDLLDYLAGK